MTIGTSLVLIAIGAILKFAVTTHNSSVDIQTIGLILFIVGLAVLPLALFHTFWWADRGVAPDDPRANPPPPPRF